MPPQYYEKMDSLAKSYGFEICRTGCRISTGIANGTKYYNNVMEKHIGKKYGVDWWTKYEAQLDDIRKSYYANLTIKKVLDLVSEQKVVKYQIKLLDSISKNQRHISLIPTLIDSINNVFLVKVCEDNRTNFMTYFNFLVDANSMTIINNDGKLDEQ